MKARDIGGGGIGFWQGFSGVLPNCAASRPGEACESAFSSDGLAHPNFLWDIPHRRCGSLTFGERTTAGQTFRLLPPAF